MGCSGEVLVRAYLRYVVHNFEGDTPANQALMIRELRALAARRTVDLERLVKRECPAFLPRLAGHEPLSPTARPQHQGGGKTAG